MTHTALHRTLHRTLRLVLVVLSVQALVSNESRADAVAVLPMTSNARSLQLYETATATALAKTLSVKIGQSAKAVGSPSEVAKNVRVIVDGRMLLVGKQQVKLEASVRKTATGKSVGTVATSALPTTDLDTLVAELSAKLAPLVVRGLAVRAEIRLPTAIVKGTRSVEAGAAPPSPAQVLLLTPTGTVASGVVSVVEPAAAGALEMLARMGLSAARSRAAQHDAASMAEELKTSGAAYALMVDVREVRFSFRSVLSARGTVHITMVGRDGQLVFNKTMRTGTLVGGRGDKHQAMVFRVVDQAFDMLLPQFRALLSKEVR